MILPSVPDKPMDSPTSAAFNAGPSLVPSPVTPTTSPPDSARLLLHSSMYMYTQCIGGINIHVYVYTYVHVYILNINSIRI